MFNEDLAETCKYFYSQCSSIQLQTRYVMGFQPTPMCHGKSYLLSLDAEIDHSLSWYVLSFWYYLYTYHNDDNAANHAPPQRTQSQVTHYKFHPITSSHKFLVNLYHLEFLINLCMLAAIWSNRFPQLQNKNKQKQDPQAALSSCQVRWCWTGSSLQKNKKVVLNWFSSFEKLKASCLILLQMLAFQDKWFYC